MTGRHKYVILSQKILSEEDRSKIIEITGGATLTWVGDKENVERNDRGHYVYNLECSELTLSHPLIKTMSLEMSVVGFAHPGTGTGANPNVLKNSDKPAFLRRIMD
jgi:hypothetical protein